MSRIEISPQAQTTLAKRIVFGESYYSYQPNSGSAWPLLVDTSLTSLFIGCIYLMQGPVPTDVTTLTNISQRSSDILGYWQAGTAQIQSAIQCVNNQVIFSLPYMTALQNGTATWFWIAVRDALAYGKTDFTVPGVVYNSVVGSIGPLGSGLDLEMVDPNVIQGNSYRIANLRITFPTFMDY